MTIAYLSVSPSPSRDQEENYGRGNIKQFNDLKRVSPQLKTLAAVGGWNEGSETFSLASGLMRITIPHGHSLNPIHSLQVANDPKLRERFALDAAQFALRHNFDGIDLDWEYPGQRGGHPETDKDAFVLLLKDLHRELAKHNLLLTAAFAVTKSAATVSYDIPEVVK